MNTASDVGAPTHPSRALHIAFWVVQILLAVAFGGAGLMKLTHPIDQLASKMAWVNFFSPGMVHFIGFSELLGAIGLVFPAATRVKPGLTSLAALGLVVVMVLAIGFHVTQNEAGMVGPALLLGALAAFVAWGRFKKAPIPPRS